MYVQGRRVPIKTSEFQSFRNLHDDGHLHDPIWARMEEDWISVMKQLKQKYASH